MSAKNIIATSLEIVFHLYEQAIHALIDGC